LISWLNVVGSFVQMP